MHYTGSPAWMTWTLEVVGTPPLHTLPQGRTFWVCTYTFFTPGISVTPSIELFGTFHASSPSIPCILSNSQALAYQKAWLQCVDLSFLFHLHTSRASTHAPTVGFGRTLFSPPRDRRRHIPPIVASCPASNIRYTHSLLRDTLTWLKIFLYLPYCWEPSHHTFCCACTHFSLL